MLDLLLKCPECGKEFIAKGRWLFTSPFHGWLTRKTKCPFCDKWGYMSWNKIEKK